MRLTGIRYGYTLGVVSVSHALLGLLHERPQHGYDLKQQFDRLFSPDRPLPFGQVYATLARLQRDGRIEAAGLESGAGPDRKRYEITTTGADELERWLAEPVKPEPQLQTQLFTKVVLALLVGERADVLLDRQRRAHIARMRELTAYRREAGLGEALLADHAIYHLEADLRWIDATVARLDDLRRTLSSRPEPRGPR